MDRYVSQGTAGCTELRVHGVSGTPPESELGHPGVELVAGDRLAGFYRRVWETGSGVRDGDTFRREGYAWGRLTSGDNSRALWLLLLPFMFLNLAHYMDPGHRIKDGRTHVVPERTAAQRLLALSLTGTYVLAATAVSMDLVAWQCGKDGQQVCTGGGFWLNWLEYDWLDSTGRRLAVAALLPLALIALLWWSARRTWATMEAQPVPQVPDRPARVELLLEDRQLWNGRGAVRQLRALHVAAALALVGVLLLAPLLPDRALTALGEGDNWQSTAAVLRNLLLLALLLVLAGIVLWVPWAGERSRPRADETPLPREADIYRFLPLLVLLLVAGALAMAGWGAADANPAATSDELPWQAGAVRSLLVAQGALLLFLLASHVGRRTAGPPSSPAAAFGNRDFPRPAWGGLGMAGVALLATVLATALAAGVTLRMAEILGAPTVPGHGTGEQRPLVVPTAYFWAAVCALALVVVALVVVALAWAGIRRSRGTYETRVTEDYPPGELAQDPSGERRRSIGGSWALAQRLDSAGQSGLGRLLLAAAVIAAAGVVLDLAFGTRLVTDGPRWLTTAANLVLTGLVAALLWAGRQAYRSEGFRRTVGILWDIGTFWPRATHPFAPPCYAERTIPDLLTRLEYLTGAAGNATPGKVLLSCHSQGSVIGTAVLMQARTGASVRTAFLTYGCPVTRLYVRFFPAYFNARALDRLGQILANDDRLAAPSKTPDMAAGTRWRNLYRLSDPIGGWVVQDVPTAEPGVVDQQLLDPASFAKRPGDTCFQPPKGHSGYFTDPAFDAAVTAFMGEVEAAAATPCEATPCEATTGEDDDTAGENTTGEVTAPVSPP